VNPSEKNNPTNRKARFVAPEGERSRELRQLLVGLWRFVRKERPLQGTTGEISLWICQLWGLGRMRQSGGEIKINGCYAEAAEALGGFGPKLSPEQIKRKHAQSVAMRSQAGFKDMIEAAKNRDISGFNADFEGMTKALIGVWLPDFEPPFELSFDVIRQMIRAFRATLICTALDRVNPLTMIAKAWKGDKEAVLGLVRADKLFLQDRCSQAVIRNAGLQNDQQFLDELARAQKFQPQLHRRDLVHIYFHWLFFTEAMGQSLPRCDELQRLLDPNGTIFEGLYAFERDLQRQREHFRNMLTEAYTELPALLSLYASALPGGG
jgi:hypothetical protein